MPAAASLGNRLGGEGRGRGEGWEGEGGRGEWWVCWQGRCSYECQEIVMIIMIIMIIMIMIMIIMMHRASPP